MIRVGICDDSAEFRNHLKNMISEWESRPGNFICDFFCDGTALISAHSRQAFDIIFLDMIMPFMNGIKTAQKIRESDRSVKIVFLTSSTEFAVESYTVKASNYLVKPLDPEAFFSCLDELISDISASSRCVKVKSKNSYIRLLLSEIEYVESQGKHIVFNTADQKNVRSSEPLYSYDSILTAEDGFFKCHRSYIVNINHIRSYSYGEIVMRSGAKVPLARSCQKDFESMYFNTIFGMAGDDK